MSKGCVDARPFVRVMETWLSEQEAEDDKIEKHSGARPLVGPIRRLSNLLGMYPANVRKILNGNRPSIGFDIADKIVTVCTDGLGWIGDPELMAIYESFDFEWLDRAKPCVPCVGAA